MKGDNDSIVNKVGIYIELDDNKRKKYMDYYEKYFPIKLNEIDRENAANVIYLIRLIYPIKNREVLEYSFNENINPHILKNMGYNYDYIDLYLSTDYIVRKKFVSIFRDSNILKAKKMVEKYADY